MCHSGLHADDCRLSVRIDRLLDLEMGCNINTLAVTTPAQVHLTCLNNQEDVKKTPSTFVKRAWLNDERHNLEGCASVMATTVSGLSISPPIAMIYPQTAPSRHSLHQKKIA
jgi:hypothetical protein